MRHELLLIALLLMKISSMAIAKEGSVGFVKEGALITSISEVNSMLPVDNVEEGFKLIDMLDRIKDPNMNSQKAEVLVIIYESQNTLKNDNTPDLPGPPTLFRRLQLGALYRLAELPASSSLEQAYRVLQSYLLFMNHNGADNPRRRLQLSMAALLNTHIAEPKIQSIASEYLKSKAFQEWTKGRISTGILKHNVGKISNIEDPLMAKRFDLILDTASLSSLEEMLRAPKRLINCSEILYGISKNDPDKLLKYIKKKREYTDSQKYFLIFALLNREVEMIQEKKLLKKEDSELINKALLWRTDIKSKAEKIKHGDRLIEKIFKCREKVKSKK